MLAQAIAGALDLDDDGVVEQAVEQAVATTGSPKPRPIR